jgi:hypothetical protein
VSSLFRKDLLVASVPPLYGAIPHTCTIADVHTIQRSIANHVEYTLASSRFNFDDFKAYLATAHRFVTHFMRFHVTPQP